MTAAGQNLHFSENGTFKIVQFTDTHIAPEKSDSEVALQVIRETLAAENPDFIVFTGDVVTGNLPKRLEYAFAGTPTGRYSFLYFEW